MSLKIGTTNDPMEDQGEPENQNQEHGHDGNDMRKRYCDVAS